MNMFVKSNHFAISITISLSDDKNFHSHKSKVDLFEDNNLINYHVAKTKRIFVFHCGQKILFEIEKMLVTNNISFSNIYLRVNPSPFRRLTRYNRVKGYTERFKFCVTNVPDVSIALESNPKSKSMKCKEVHQVL